MIVALRADLNGEHASLVPSGPFDLAHAATATRAIESAEASLVGARSVGLDLTHLDRIDGAGAVLLARLLDRLDANGLRVHVIDGSNSKATRLIELYRARARHPPAPIHAMSSLTRLGALASHLPGKVNEALDFTGRYAAALPKTVVAPSSADWRSLPRLIQEIGADSLPVTSAANFLIGAIMGIIGGAQLGRFGMVALIPGSVVVTHFRELGPLVTGLIVAGRAGAGLASEISTMKVSEEIDALQSMGFDPVRWLVVPRCLALAVTLPLLTWVGDLLALAGGLLATTAITTLTAHKYVELIVASITAEDFLTGLAKTPFLGLAIGLIACGEGLRTRGGAAAVGTRTTTAVVLALFSVIVLNALFTFLFALMGI